MSPASIQLDMATYPTPKDSTNLRLKSLKRLYYKHVLTVHTSATDVIVYYSSPALSCSWDSELLDFSGYKQGLCNLLGNKYFDCNCSVYLNIYRIGGNNIKKSNIPP